MRPQSKGFCETVFVNMGLMVIATIILVSFSGSFASAYVVPQASDADAMGDGRIEILRRSGADGEGMDEALKYLEELDKYYAQVARPRGMYKVVVSPSNRFAYNIGPTKESQNTANTIVLDDEDEEPEEKMKPLINLRSKELLIMSKGSRNFQIFKEQMVDCLIWQDQDLANGLVHHI